MSAGTQPKQGYDPSRNNFVSRPLRQRADRRIVGMQGGARVFEVFAYYQEVGA